MGEAQALGWPSAASGFGLPSAREALREWGLAPEALGGEVRRAVAAGVHTLLVGIELVELEGIVRLDEIDRSVSRCDTEEGRLGCDE